MSIRDACLDYGHDILQFTVNIKSQLSCWGYNIAAWIKFRKSVVKRIVSGHEANIINKNWKLFLYLHK